ncbi:MAG: DUF261 domain-containing protein [Spirochaetaceae bacterium]|jgi:hypothetical protein|nr:DUF261 domain-containing protein [Spirochaetaceae bacterium]
MKDGVQDFIKTVGESGCYALCLAEAAAIYNRANRVDVGYAVTAISIGVSHDYIKPDMTVLDGAAFLKQMTGEKWTKEYKPADYKPVEGDYLIAEWFNKRTGFTHFTLAYPQKWDPLTASVTVKEGVIRSYRLYRENL